jgi:hypothetical protein
MSGLNSVSKSRGYLRRVQRATRKVREVCLLSLDIHLVSKVATARCMQGTSGEGGAVGKLTVAGVHASCVSRKGYDGETGGVEGGE